MTPADYFKPLPPPDALIFWVIYFRPPDMPGAEYVVRPQYAEAYTGQILCSPISRSAPTLEAVRELIPGRYGLYRQERDKSDPLCIVESWF
jgi:hypothetical protein